MRKNSSWPAVLLIAPSIVVVQPAFLSSPAAIPQHKNIVKIPDAAVIESEIFSRLNQERRKRNLRPLAFSEELSRLAKNHCRDMAGRAELSHFSSTGQTYTERLIAADLYFVGAGENVARGDSFVAEFIHQKLMQSSGHRENMLDPAFDAVGIGVVAARDGLYYITQDFLRSLDLVPLEEARQRIKKTINQIRTKESLMPLLFQDDINTYADGMSLRKAKNSPQPPVPETFGQTHIILVTVPSLDMLAPQIKDAAAEIYDRSAVGVWFGRTEDQPGGAYVITTILFVKDRLEDLSHEDLANVVLEELNRIRERHNLKGLKLNKSLSRDAWRIALASRSPSIPSYALPNRLLEFSIVTYASEDPSFLPQSLIDQVPRIQRGRIGIGVCSAEEKNQERLYVVTIIY